MYQEYIPFAEQLADKARDIIRPYYRNLERVTAKADRSPVTLADQDTERAIRHLIGEHYPDHGIIGEEFGISNPDADYMWVLDPIDGTKSFVIGRPIFGTLIGLLYQGTPILGVIDQPITEERWIGGGNETRYNGEIVHTRQVNGLEYAILCTTGPEYFNPIDRAPFERVSQAARYTVWGGDCYNYALLASGQVDVIVEANLNPYDIAALIPVVTGAGGILTDWQGNPAHPGEKGKKNIIATTHKALHDQVLSLIKGT